MGEVKGQGHTDDPVSNQDALPFCFTSIGPTIPKTWPIDFLALKKHTQNFEKKSSTTEFLKKN